MMKRKINVARIVWVVCLFLFLILVLLMVMDYKINYQYLRHNELYFYECDGELCVTQIEDSQKSVIATFDCGYDACPQYKRVISDNFVLLDDGGQFILYSYKNDSIISKDYDDYEFIDGRYIIVKKGSVYGIIDINNKVIVSPNYDEIGIHSSGYLTGYSVNEIVVKKNDKYGLISFKDGKLIENFKYDEDHLDELIDIMKKRDS